MYRGRETENPAERRMARGAENEGYGDEREERRETQQERYKRHQEEKWGGADDNKTKMGKTRSAWRGAKWSTIRTRSGAQEEGRKGEGGEERNRRNRPKKRRRLSEKKWGNRKRKEPGGDIGEIGKDRQKEQAKREMNDDTRGGKDRPRVGYDSRNGRGERWREREIEHEWRYKAKGDGQGHGVEIHRISGAGEKIEGEGEMGN